VLATSLDKERKSLANGYLSDLDQVNQSMWGFLCQVYNKDDPDYGKLTYWTLPLYPEWGLYYSNRQEISKFDPSLSKDMYDFYYLVLSAEYLR
jgi:hypothetical protein